MESMGKKRPRPRRSFTPRDGRTGSERQELAAQRRENRRLREGVEIFRRATVFFAKETR